MNYFTNNTLHVAHLCTRMSFIINFGLHGCNLGLGQSNACVYALFHDNNNVFDSYLKVFCDCFWDHLCSIFAKIICEISDSTSRRLSHTKDALYSCF